MMKPIRQGMEAFRRGVTSSKEWVEGVGNNPYTPGTSRHKDWEFGYNIAYFQNLERVKNGETKNKRRER